MIYEGLFTCTHWVGELTQGSAILAVALHTLDRETVPAQWLEAQVQGLESSPRVKSAVDYG